MPRYSPPLPFRRGRAGARACWPARAGAWLRGRGCARWLARPGRRPGSRPRTCALAGGPAPVPGSGVAVGRAGWRARARGPGRGRVRAGWPAGPRPCLARGSRLAEASLRMGGEGECAQTGDSNAGCDYPVRGYSIFSGEVTCPVILLPSILGVAERGAALLASLCSPFSGVFQFLDRYISLARNIGYVTIKPMTKYCPVFMLSLADVQ